MYLDEEGKQKDRKLCYMELSLVDAVVVRLNCFIHILMTIISIVRVNSTYSVVANTTLSARVSVAVLSV